jgi:DNA modification methylase
VAASQNVAIRPTSIEQPSLFESTPLSNGSSPTNGASAFADPAFASNKSAPIHRWVPWIAGFSREFVQGAFERHLPKKGAVLDPFAGVGTTLVEAVLAGHETIGFEINPYAALACRTKLNACYLDPDAVAQAVAAFQVFYRHTTKDESYNPKSAPPPGFKSRVAFYSPQILRKVLIVQDCIASLEEETLRDLFRIAFASTMVRYSNYSYEPSLGTRVAAGKEGISDFPVGETITEKLNEMVHDIRWMCKSMNGCRPAAKVFNETFFHCQGRIPPMSIDLLVTSPPYLNNYHYNRNTRPHLYWLGFATRPADFEPLAEQNFGTFWQTARERECIELDARIKDSEIRECVALLRTKTPEKGMYGGNGWANYAASYLNDCYRFVEAAHYALKPQGTALVVIGNSILQGVMIPTDCYLGKIAEEVGLELVDIHIPRATRVGNSIIQSDVRVEKAHASHQLYEAVVELRRR